MPQMLDLTAQFIDDYGRLQRAFDDLQSLQNARDGVDHAAMQAEIDRLSQRCSEDERRLSAARAELENANRRIVELKAALDAAALQLQASDVALKSEREQHAATRSEANQLRIQIGNLIAKSESRKSAGQSTGSPAQFDDADKRLKSLEADKEELQEEVKRWKAKFHGCEKALLEQRRK